MDHEEIIERHAENIMQRVNDTWPRTLNKDVLRDEIGKAIREAIQLWQPPPPLFHYDPLTQRSVVIEDQVTLSHDKMRARLDQHLADYYGKPND